MTASRFPARCAALLCAGTAMLGLAAAALSSPAHALDDDPYFDIDRDPTTAPRGAEDSTTGSSVTVATEASFEVTPSSLSWGGYEADITEQAVAVTNGGNLSSLGDVDARTTGNFTITASSCTTLRSGQSCEIRIKPRAGFTGSFSGDLELSSESGAAASVDLSADILQPRYGWVHVGQDQRDMRFSSCQRTEARNITCTGTPAPPEQRLRSVSFQGEVGPGQQAAIYGSSYGGRIASYHAWTRPPQHPQQYWEGYTVQNFVPEQETITVRNGDYCGSDTVATVTVELYEYRRLD